MKTELPNPYSLIFELIFAAAIVAISLVQMNKRVNLKLFINSLINRITKRN